MKFRYSILIPLLIAASSAVLASAPVEVKHYLALRRAYATYTSLQTIKSDTASYIGKVVEIRGPVAGFSKSASGCSMIVNTDNSGSFVINTDSAPCESPGMPLACLAKIGEGSTNSLSDLSLVACTYEADLQRIEDAASAREPKSTATTTTAHTKTAAEPTSQPISSDQFIAAYRNAIKKFNRRLSDSQADTIARSVVGFSGRYRVDPRLVCAVILAESHFRLSATSRCGAQGLGQLMPGTAAGLGLNDAYDPVQNVYGSVRYIKSMLDRVSGNKRWESLSWYDLGLALAAYNAGFGAVKKHGGIPPYKETQGYVRRVTSIYKQLCGVK